MKRYRVLWQEEQLFFCPACWIPWEKKHSLTGYAAGVIYEIWRPGGWEAL